MFNQSISIRFGENINLVMRILTILAFLFSALVSNAQSSRGLDFVDGYILTNQGDTVTGQICYINTKTNERLDRIYFLAENGSKKRIGPEKLNGFGMEGKDFEWVELGDGYGKIIMQRIVEGDINMYYAWFKSEDSTPRLFAYEKAIFLQKRKQLHEVLDRKFEKNMANYFKGDEDIIEMMKKNKWGINDLDKIVKAYNAKE